MLVLKAIIVAINASFVHCFLGAREIKSRFDVTIQGLRAVPQESSNAFDLLDDELRQNLSKELGILEPNEIQNMSLPIAIGGNDTSVIAHLTRAHTKIITRLFPDIETIRQSSSSQRVLVPTLRQVFHYFSGDMSAKLAELEDVLEKSEKQSTIIFCKDENEVEAVHLFLKNSKTLGDAFSPEKLHINLSSEERSTALSRFRTNEKECLMLVTHEIAARGLDCPSVRHVVLFDTPTDVTAFVHRAGRTARAGEEGVVTCLVQAGGGLGSFGQSGGSFGQHKDLHALLDAPKLKFAKATDEEIKEKTE